MIFNARHDFSEKFHTQIETACGSSILIDKRDATTFIRAQSWHLSPRNVPFSLKTDKYLHEYIYRHRVPPRWEIFHKNGNALDNRALNLEIRNTPRQGLLNEGKTRYECFLSPYVKHAFFSEFLRETEKKGVIETLKQAEQEYRMLLASGVSPVFNGSSHV